MSPIRKLLLVGVGVLALHGVQACSTETELNPQPLPPGQGSGDPTRAPADQGEKTADPNGSSGTGGAGTPPTAADAGADADGGDGGDG